MSREVAATLQFSAAAILIQRADPIDPMARINFASERLAMAAGTPDQASAYLAGSARPARLRGLDAVEAVSG